MLRADHQSRIGEIGATINMPTRFVLTGGGTGGHITPIIAVAHELKRLQPDCHIVYIGERGGVFMDLVHESGVIDETRAIWAGKLRRYHGESWLRRLLDVKTNFFNIRDAVHIGLGIVQSWFLLGQLKPDIILLKGGFVGVPVGLAAALRKLAFVTHDSDVQPGLANRMVSKWAACHAVAAPVNEYRYPAEKTIQVGVLVGPQFVPVTDDIQKSYKEQLRVPVEVPLLLITGGSTGAQRLNAAMTKVAPGLLGDYPDLRIIHQTGKGKAGAYAAYVHDRLQVVEFMNPMYVYTGAADIVVSRSGANAVAELGVQGRALIVVPNPLLTEGHQLKNAAQLVAAGAAISISETADATNEAELDDAIRKLLNEPELRKALASQLHAVTIMDAAQRLANVLIKLAVKQ
jgi:UDP-N-acetylglucosamine--N-acetylmuramyl-(pentapeptide) pyrophosphoryl-undecaprenol N-acetylglucosamine transferase